MLFRSEYAVGADPAKHTKADQMRVSAVMKRFGTEPVLGDVQPEDAWEHVRQRWPEGGREWRWVRVRAGGGDAPAPVSAQDRNSWGADEPDF